MRYTFTAAQVRSVVEHAKAGKDHFKPYGESATPAVLLVRDDGVYLMSSNVDAMPRFVVHPAQRTQGGEGDDFVHQFTLDTLNWLDKLSPDAKVVFDVKSTRISILYSA